MVRGLCKPFDRQAYLEGHMTPVYFGSALNNFGVRELLEGVAEMAPAPRPQPAAERLVNPDEDQVAAFVFKIKPTWIPSTAIASPSCGCPPATSSAARSCCTYARARR